MKSYLDPSSPIAVGKIPDGGIQAITYAIINNDTDYFYEVPAGQTLYLSHVSVSIRNDAGAVGYGYAGIANAVPVFQYLLIYANCPIDDGKMASLAFSPPIEVEAGWFIGGYSSLLNLRTAVFIHGYII